MNIIIIISWSGHSIESHWASDRECRTFWPMLWCHYTWIIAHYMMVNSAEVAQSVNKLLLFCCRRGGSGRWRLATWMVHHNIPWDLQPDVCAVLYVARRPCDLHHQPIVPLQLKPSQLLQVCRPNHCQSRLWQQAARVLLHAILLQTHSRHPSQVSCLQFTASFILNWDNLIHF